MEQNGELVIETTCDKKNVNVKIIDSGSGIPAEIQSRIFDPFFTTKKVGEGTGIGLDLVQRIIKRHNGDIKVFSKPGRTEFYVCIPISQQ
jgi:signal transduction histidine kinase